MKYNPACYKGSFIEHHLLGGLNSVHKCNLEVVQTKKFFSKEMLWETLNIDGELNAQSKGGACMSASCMMNAALFLPVLTISMATK